MGRAIRMGWGLAVALFAVQAWGAGTGAPDAGTPDAGLPTEVGVHRTDAGFEVEANGRADAGAEPAFQAPTLLADSPATYPKQLAAGGALGPGQQGTDQRFGRDPELPPRRAAEDQLADRRVEIPRVHQHGMPADVRNDVGHCSS